MTGPVIIVAKTQINMVVEAPVVAVTVLEDRASVTRRGVITLAPGQQRVVIARVSPILVDKTLHVTATHARILDVRCEREMAPWRTGEDTTPERRLHGARVHLEAERDAALARASAAEIEIDALRELTAAAYRDLAAGASRGSTAPTAFAHLAELDTRDAAARARKLDAELAAQSVSAAIARLDERIAKAEAEAGEEIAKLEIDLISDGTHEIEIAVSYVVPGAAWRPYHRAVLARAAGRIEWTTTACVWQATGEDWVDAELTCSLERPSLGVTPPDLTDDELRARRRPDTVVVEAREHEQQSTGLGGGSMQVPGIDDGGLGLVLTAQKATVRADGAPHRIPVGGFTAPAQLSLVAIPLRSPWVHLRARLHNTSPQPLLAGPVDLVMASGYVGRAEVGFVAAGEKFYLGFGPESEIRVHRTETRDRDDAGILGGWNVQTVRVAVRLSNLGNERREVTVTERIPISEVEQVDIQISSPDAYLLGADGGEEITQVTARAMDERGLVSWGVELPPLGRRAVTLEYRIRSQRGVAGV